MVFGCIAFNNDGEVLTKLLKIKNRNFPPVANDLATKNIINMALYCGWREISRILKLLLSLCPNLKKSMERKIDEYALTILIVCN